MFATGASVVNLSVGSGVTLNLTPGYVDVTGSSLINNGSIVISSGNGLGLGGSPTTLSGSGAVMMTDPNSRIGGGGAVIIQEPIQGQGALGFGTLAISNQSTISASGGTLTIQPNSVGITNTGLIQALSGATLDLVEGFAVLFNNTGGTIKAQNGSTILLQMNPSGGTLTTAGSGNFTLAPPGAGAGLTSLTNAGTFNVPAGANLNWTGAINNTGIFNLNGSISTNGSVTLNGGGTVLMNGGAFDGINANPLTNQQLIHGAGRFYQVPLTNQATIQADNASATLFIDGSATTNTATLQATGGGTLQLDTVVNNTGGTITAQDGSTVIFTNNFNGSINGGTLTTAGSGTIQSQNGVLDGTVNIPTNAGLLQANNFDLFIQGTINNAGTIALIGNSCMIMHQPATLTGSGVLTMASTTCIFGQGIPFTNQSTIEGAGSIGDSNPMPITNQGTIIANQSSPLLIVPDSTGFTNSGTLVVSSGSTMDIRNLFKNISKNKLTGGVYKVAGTLDIFKANIVTNSAPITLSGATAQIFDTFTGSSALRNLASNLGKGVLALTLGQKLTTPGNFTNAATMSVDSTSGFTAGGTFMQSGGTTTVDGTVTAAGGFVFKKGKLFGRGTITAAFSSTGTGTVTVGDSATSPGILSVGSFSQGATGILDVLIGGVTVGSQYSQLACSNAVSLGGTLTLKRIKGFVPPIGSTFTIIKAGSISGQFATVNGLSINSGEHFEISYDPAAVTLTVVSGP